MRCRGTHFLLCPKCHTWFCVPGLCAGVEVWHGECGEMLQHGYDGECVGQERVRAVVCWSPGTRRNEVRVCLEAGELRDRRAEGAGHAAG